jgi:hypothetical protein
VVARRVAARERVIAQLDRTEAIVAVSVPASDWDSALTAANRVIAYYAARPGAMVQADADGFYEGKRLVLATG